MVSDSCLSGGGGCCPSGRSPAPAAPRDSAGVEAAHAPDASAVVGVDPPALELPAAAAAEGVAVAAATWRRVPAQQHTAAGVHC